MATATEFGTDISCTTSLRTGRYASGVRLIAESAYRRLRTRRGTLRGGEDEANYGLDLQAYIGTVSPKIAAASLPGQIRSELTKDPRILEADARITTVVDGPATKFFIDVDAVTAEGPFELQLAVTDLSIELLGLVA